MKKGGRMKRFQRLTMTLGMLLVIAFCAVTSFISAQEIKGSLQIKGSDTMVNLGQAWAETFMQKYPATSLAVTGGGSGTGIAAILNGTCDIAQSSREVSA
jgi:phosphate transport system substrate-binding protein